MFPGLVTQLVLTAALVAFVYGIGAAVVHFARLPGGAWRYPLICLPAGLALSVGLFSSLSFQRPTYLLASPVALVAWLFFRRRRGQELGATAPGGNVPGEMVVWAATILVSVAFCRAWYGGAAPEGMVSLPFKDWGFFSMLVQGLVPSGHMSIWSGAVGEHLADTTHARDLWYHWGVIWLSVIVKQAAGITAWASFAAVAVPATMAISIACAAYVIVQLTGWSLPRSFVPAVLSVFFVALGPSTLLQPLLVKFFGLTGVLYCNGPFVVIPWLPFELVPVFAALWAWVSGRFSWCCVCLFFAAVSAPHAFIVLAASLGFLLVWGLIIRDGLQWRAALLGLVSVVAAWCAVNLIFGATTSKPPGIVSSPPSLVPTLWHIASRGTTDGFIALALMALAAPGIVGLLAQKGDGAPHRMHIAGLLALCALLAGGYGYRLFEALGFGAIDAVILPGMSRNLVILPIAAMGTVLLLSSRRRTPAFTGAAVFTIVAVLGAYDLPKRHAALLPESPLPAESVAAFSRKLSGGKFGYFATSDRNWWIPVHSSLAAISGSTCIRLNPLPVDQDWAGKQYGSDVPEQIVPRSDHESGEDWSGRLAEALGINHLLAGPDSVLPGPLREQFVPVADAGVYSLWERKTSGVQIK